ncbi:MAG: hypothetical protein M5U28_46650 [Sandaracinaceae bacterium]|nr:hypothetical protein [Sandaracinaceae bacterium]
MSDFDSRNFETIWGGGSCIGGMTTYSGCSARAARLRERPAARLAAPARRRRSTTAGPTAAAERRRRPRSRLEGWHPAASAGGSGGTISTSVLMERYGAHNVCFNTVDRANDRGSLSSSELCNAGRRASAGRTRSIPRSLASARRPIRYAGDGRG